MENWKMRRINFISPIYISNNKEIVESGSKHFHLMSSAVSPQHIVAVDVVTLALLSTRVIFRD